MNKIFTLLFFTFFCTSCLFAQTCNFSEFPIQLVLDSDFQYTNLENSTVVVKELSGTYPSGPGIDDDSDHSSGVSSQKAIASNSDGWIVVLPSATLGMYEIERREFGTGGCRDTIELEIVSALPVTWQKPITVLIQENEAIITFSTAQQINNSHFEIERSENGFDFEKIGRIEGEGNSLTENHYTFLDENPSVGINYYRIKQMDFDGSFEYSEILAAQVNNPDSKISFYPNPTSNIISLSLPKADQVTIYDTLGRELDRFYFEKGLHDLNLKKYEQSVLMIKVGEEWLKVLVR